MRPKASTRLRFFFVKCYCFSGEQYSLKNGMNDECVVGNLIIFVFVVVVVLLLLLTIIIIIIVIIIIITV